MKAPTFTSCLAAKMDTFCALRRLSGTDYQSQARLLGYFDTFLVHEHFSDSYLNRELVDRYMSQMIHLKPRTRSNRLSVIRQFCVYLSTSQPDCYIPERMSEKDCPFCPYIFSVEDVGLLRGSALDLKPSGSLRGQTLSTLFGLLFASGLRIGEALALNVEDLSSQALFVQQGKFRKARLVPLTPRTNSALEEYLLLREAKTPLTNGSPIFVNRKGKRLLYNNARDSFSQILLLTGIYSGQGQSPRLHDLRHSFAVERLLQWYQDGDDINQRLPSLATYMGHVGIQSTQKYIHATPRLKQEFHQRAWSYFQTNVLGSGGER